MAKERRRPSSGGKAGPKEKSAAHEARGGFVRTDAIVGALIFLFTVLVYAQTVSYEFVNYDDPEQVVDNDHVQAGLTADSVRWAVTTHLAGNWIPLTWLSFMTENQIAGSRAGVHHATNVGLHALSALLLFLILHRMTGARWPSALVASLFALHPLHVESVAWISERKDVLNGCFWMLTIWAYLRYVDRPGPRRYAAVGMAFALGLMTKAMIVTLPLVLLLLDYWPLRRFSPHAASPAARPARSLVLEKIPLMGLAAAASIVTVITQQRSTAVTSLDAIPLATRSLNALVSYGEYLRAMFWPTDLAMFYPYPTESLLVPALIAGGVLLVMSFVAWQTRTRQPYFIVGWLWYLGTLVPVIGLVQVGSQSRADRYTYIPAIGIAITLAWGLSSLAAWRPRLKLLVVGAAVAICVVCSALTYRQVQVWRNSLTLAQHAIEVTTRNDVAHGNLGMALLESGRPEEALAEFEEAVRIRPLNPEALSNVGNVLLALGRPGEALAPLTRALQLQPQLPDALLNCATALARVGRNDEALALYQRLLRQDPGNAHAHSGLGAELARRGQTSEAIAELSEATRLQPADADTHYNLGTLLARLGKNEDAERELRRAVALKPTDAQAHAKLGTTLLRLGRAADAIAEFTAALRLDPNAAEAQEGLRLAIRIKS